MRTPTILFSLCLGISAPAIAAASAGSLDPSFDFFFGTEYGINVVLIQTNARVIVAGDFTDYFTPQYTITPRLGIARLNSDASLDYSFDPTNNVAGSPLHGVKAAALLPDGRILVAGGFSVASGANRNRIARLNSDGSLDPTFNPGPGPDSDVISFAIQPDGRIVIGGDFSSVNGQPHKYIARINADGTLDTNFVASADYNVNALAVQPDGKIIVGGWFFHLNGASPANLARLNSDGTLDATFAASVGEPIGLIALQPDGKILAGGVFSAPARLLPNGSLDRGFNAEVSQSEVYAMDVQDDGKIVAGGFFVQGTNITYMVRFYSDGSIDHSFTNGIDNLVEAITIQPDGRFLIAGGFGYVDGVEEGGAARLYGDDQTATPLIEINGQAFQAYESDPYAIVPVLRTGNTNTAVSVQYATADLDAQAGSDYIATSGVLNFAAGEVAKTISIPLIDDFQIENVESFSLFLTNATNAVLGTSTNATISIVDDNIMVQIASGDIMIDELAGSISITLRRAGTNVSSSVLCQTVNGTAIAGVNFSGVSQTILFAAGDATKYVSIPIIDDALPGPDTSFSVQLSNPTNTQIGAQSNVTVTILNNNAPGHPGLGLNGSVSVVTATGDGGALLGGNFTSINGVPRTRIGKILGDASLDASFDPGTGLNGWPDALAVQPDGRIICAGSFTSYNGVSSGNLIRLNPDGSIDASFNPGAANGTVSSLALLSDGTCFAGGSFSKFGTVNRAFVAKLGADGTVDTNFVPQLATGFPSVLCVTPQEDGRLLVGGTYYPYRIQSTNCCVRLNADGSRDLSFNATIYNGLGSTAVRSIAVQPDGKILVGGSFTTVNGIACGNIARLNADGSVDAYFDPGAGANSSINKLLLLDTGKVLAVGAFTNFAGVSCNRIMRLNSDGTIDPAFNPGAGADSSIMDIACLSAGQLGIGGAFHSFNGFPRYNFAIVSADGPLVNRIAVEDFSLSDTGLDFGLLVEPTVLFQLQCSSNLTDWQNIYSNSIQQDFLNLTLPAGDQPQQFYRLLQSP